MGELLAKGTVAQIIPVWRADLAAPEIERINHNIDVFGRDDTFLVGPHSVATNRWEAYIGQTAFRAFPDKNFTSRNSYSRWLLTASLYSAFSEYEFIMICQSDALLLERPNLKNWPWDYVGASWQPEMRVAWSPLRRSIVHSGFGVGWKSFSVGNGGLSIRRTSAFIDFCARLPRMMGNQNEDIVIGYFASKLGLSVAPKDVADAVFVEEAASSWANGLPVPQVAGFHALEKFNPDLERYILEGGQEIENLGLSLR